MTPEPSKSPLISIGEYRLYSKFAEEPWWATFIAEEAPGNEKALVRILSPRLSSNEKAFTRFQSAVNASATAGDEGVLAFSRTGVDRNYHYVAYRYFQGTPFKSLLKERRALTAGEVATVAEQIIAALQHAHLRGIVHGRLSSSTVLVDQALRIKIMDFGMHPLVEHLFEFGTANDKRWLLPFMSPEQVLLHGEIDGRSDFYSLGVLLYEAITGKLPFSGADAEQLSYRVVSAPPGSIKKYAPDIAAPLEDFIMRCLEKNPDDRFLNCREMSEAVRGFTPQAGGEEVLTSLSDWEGERRRSIPGTAAAPPGKRRGWVTVIVTALPLLVFLLSSAVVTLLLARRHDAGGKANSSRPSYSQRALLQPLAEGNAIESAAPQKEVFPAARPDLIENTTPSATRAPTPATAGDEVVSPARAMPKAPATLPPRREVESAREIHFERVPFAGAIRVDQAGTAQALPTRISLHSGAHTLEYLDENGNVVWRTEKIFGVRSDSTFRAAVEIEFGSLAVVVKNADEYGFAYVFIDGEEWKKGGTSATPMLTRVPVGAHRIRVVRDGFEAVPRDTLVTVRRDLLARALFALRPLR